MQKLIITFLLMFSCFACLAQNRQTTNYKSSGNTSKKYIYQNTQADATKAINNGDCIHAGRILVKLRISSGSLFNAWRGCVQSPTEGETDDAVKFNPETDNLPALPKIVKPIGNENVNKGNSAFQNEDYEEALGYYRTYMIDNMVIFENPDYEDWLEKFLEKIKYCLDMLEEDE